MGVSESKCVNLAAEQAYLDESYTVIRTSGQQETGWLLTSTVHRCYNHGSHSWRPRAHAYLKKEGWVLSLHNGDQEDAEGNIVASHCCGWRTLGTFWPTRLTGDEEAIAAWTEQLRDRLEELAGHKGIPDIWAEHSCGRGAPPDYCDGCCAERRAMEKKALLDQLAAIAAERMLLDEELETILCEKEHIHNTQDLWDPKWGARWEDLEEQECEIARKHNALDEKAYPLQQALKKIPTAAQHRKWRAWRDVADKLEEAERDGLSTDVQEELKQEADALYPAAFPPQEDP
jgi:hypothetical protein